MHRSRSRFVPLVLSLAFASSGGALTRAPADDADLPEGAAVILKEHGENEKRLQQRVDEALRDDRQRCLEVLDRAAVSARKRGSTKEVEALQRLKTDLEREVEGLPQEATIALEKYRRAVEAENVRLEEALLQARAEVSQRLQHEAKQATRDGNDHGARAIQAIVDEYEAAAREAAAAKERARYLKLLLGSWDVTIGKYHAVWTFHADGRLVVTEQRYKKQQPPDKETRYEVQADRIFMAWNDDGTQWDDLAFPIDPAGTTGKSWTKNPVRAKKRR